MSKRINHWHIGALARLRPALFALFLALLLPRGAWGVTSIELTEVEIPGPEATVQAPLDPPDSPPRLGLGELGRDSRLTDWVWDAWRCGRRNAARKTAQRERLHGK